MSIAAQLEANIRERCRDRLPLVSSAMVDDTRAACSRRSGTLADSIEADAWAEEGDRYTTTIRATVDYAQYQDEGTGIYGPTGMRIFPTSAKVLVFDWPAAGGVVFARSVAGAPGTHFWSGDDGQAMARRFSDAMNANW